MVSLIDRIDAFLASTGMSDSQFGLHALNDKNFVAQLRNGRDVRLSTAEKVEDFMSRYQSGAAA